MRQVPNEYIVPAEITTFRLIVFSKKGLTLFPNGTDPTPIGLTATKPVVPTAGRPAFAAAIADKLNAENFPTFPPGYCGR